MAATAETLYNILPSSAMEYAGCTGKTDKGVQLWNPHLYIAFVLSVCTHILCMQWVQSPHVESSPQRARNHGLAIRFPVNIATVREDSSTRYSPAKKYTPVEEIVLPPTDDMPEKSQQVVPAHNFNSTPTTASDKPTNKVSSKPSQRSGEYANSRTKGMQQRASNYRKTGVKRETTHTMDTKSNRSFNSAPTTVNDKLKSTVLPKASLRSGEHANSHPKGAKKHVSNYQKTDIQRQTTHAKGTLTKRSLLTQSVVAQTRNRGAKSNTSGFQSGNDDLPLILEPRYRGTPVPPHYPRQAIRRNQQGTVLIRARISAQGKVKSAWVFRSSGYGLLDASALSAVRRWTFVPAMRAGVSTESRVQVPVQFSLKQ